MIPLLKTGAMALIAGALLAGCNSSPKVTTEETVTVKRMDSTEQVVETTKEKLEKQTKAVEASLEKLDDTFEKDN